MLENRIALTLCIGYIIGIIMGLYCKISIALFYIAFLIIYLIFTPSKIEQIEQNKNKAKNKKNSDLVESQSNKKISDLVESQSNKKISDLIGNKNNKKINDIVGNKNNKKINDLEGKKNNKKRKLKLFSIKRYFRYIKLIFNKKVTISIIIISIISNTVVLIQNSKYENLYKNLDEKNCSFQGIIVYRDENKIKVKICNPQYKNTYLYIYVAKGCKITYNDKNSNDYNESKIDNNESKTDNNDGKINKKESKTDNNDGKIDNNKTNSINYGDKIVFKGIFSNPKKATNYKGFDTKNYYKLMKVYGTIKAEEIKVIDKEKGNAFLKYTNILASKIEKKIENLTLKEEQKAILKGILLGDKKEISKEVLNNFSISNISHILAVSGMHISYVIIFSNFIFNKIIGKHYSKIATSIIIGIYMCIVNFTPSVMRAGITGIIVIMSNFFYRKNDLWQTIMLSLFCILIYNPFLIQDVGLQLSFAGSAGIIIFSKTVNKWIEDVTDRAERKAIRRNNRKILFIIKIINSKCGKTILDAIIVTFSASIAVSPIILTRFNNVSISSLIISVIASLIIAPIVILGIVVVIFNIEIIDVLLNIFLELLAKIAQIGTKLPLNQIYLSTPNKLNIILYYLVILILNLIVNVKLEKNKNIFQKRFLNIISVLKYKIKSNKKRIISIILILCILNTILTLIPKKLKIHFIDVGQGDCTVITTPHNKSILIDGGGKEFGDYDTRRKYCITLYIK